MLDALFRWLMPWRYRQTTDIASTFRDRYAQFKELLNANAELSRIIADIEEKLQGHQLYGMTYVRSRANRAVFQTRRMVETLNVISGNKYPQLRGVLSEIEANIQATLGARHESPPEGWTLPFSRITRDMVDWVGSKNANLGEVMNRTHLPIPDGFAITTRACEYFFSSNHLVDIIREKLEQELPDSTAINRISEELQQLIISAPIPEDLSQDILASYDQLVTRIHTHFPGARVAVAMRSSAVGEDTELSHAGQYLTLLNVDREGILSAYVRVIASLFSPWAMSYRLSKGARDEDILMGVACLQMVDSVSSGVVFSRHPFRDLEEVTIISAVWGLGPTAVDGNLTPDTYTIARDESFRVMDIRIAKKPFQLVATPEGGLVEAPVPINLQSAACLTPDQAQALAKAAVELEKHYGAPQDMEWALDRAGNSFILQSRPLKLELLTGPPHAGAPNSANASLGNHTLLLEGGVVASPGVGIGPIHRVESEEDLKTFPEGGVLLARHPSPRYVLVMPRAAAILTDTGSALGHMASLCREFGVATLLDLREATQHLANGMIVTVDAYSGRVYQGRVEELLERRANETPYMKNTPVSQTLEKVAELIIPLRLINPRAPTFAPRSCRSLHDIMRFVHESSYAAMFRISDLLSESEGGAVKLLAPIPLDLYLIDLGGGLSMENAHKRTATVEQITSIPFQALIKGMLHPELRLHRPRPIELGGFFSVMSEQMFTPPGSGGERFGDRSYAIISDKYVHFSSRIGYHYSILDSYFDEMPRKSYITFSFQGGAADETRRGRRARAITLVLKAHGFTVDNKVDRVDARLKRMEAAEQLEVLDMLGRLLQFTRQLDMLMRNETSVSIVAQAFMDGQYDLDHLLQ